MQSTRMDPLIKMKPSKQNSKFQAPEQLPHPPFLKRQPLIGQLGLLCSVLLLAGLQLAAGSSEPETASTITGRAGPNNETSRLLPANHRMEAEGEADPSETVARPAASSRAGRQYDGPLSAGTGSYAALSSDAGAYVGSPASAAAYSAAGPGGSPASYGAELGGYGPQTGGASYHMDPLSVARNYPMGPIHPSAYPPPPGHPLAGGPLASMFNSGGLLSASGSMFPLMAKGFDVSEIICTAIAVAIGAVIVGAPFILLYLFLMNQMNGGSGPGGMGPSGGAISLTGPTSSTTVSGRKKRQTSFPEALFRQLSPLVNNEQLASSFKMLMNSLAKYQK